MSHTDCFYIGGEWTPPSGTAAIEVVNPSTEEPFGRVPQGRESDIDRAVQAASSAFAGWSSTPPKVRRDYLTGIIDSLRSRHDEVADTIAREIGTPRKVAGWLQTGIGVIDLETIVAAMDTYEWEQQLGSSTILREAAGVVGAITPWNYPLHQITAKVGAALAAGCTVVLKPSELSPLTAYLFAEMVDEAGLPAGVFNLVTGYGSEVGEALVRHSLVGVISFTGSNAVGKRVAALAAEHVKRVALELGGKSATLVLDDADVEKAVRFGLRSCYQNAGQTCNALTRMVVPRSLVSRVDELAVEAAKTYTTGNPFDPTTRLGPMVSARQRERVRGYVAQGVQEGARLLTGGNEAAVPTVGFFVAPTVFTDVAPDMTIAQEEIFGPVLAIILYESEEDGIDITNGTIFGLHAAVWSQDPDRAAKVARRLQAGQVTVNGGEFNPQAPFGGFKQSGLGREGGRFGIDEFTEIKSLQF